MAAQKGLDMLLKVDSDGSGTYLTVAGLQNLSIRRGRETVDITSQDDVSRARQLLEGAGVKSISITGSGVFKDAAADQTLSTYFENGTIRNWRIIIPSFNQIQGPFQITDLENSSTHNGEVQQSLTLESGGDYSLTPI